MDQTLILVDEKDNFLGYASLEECHKDKGKRHRAFVTLLFDSKNRVALQKRKHRLFDNFWDFTAISHPLHLEDGHDEIYQEASDRALAREMGILHVPIKKVRGFNYFAQDGENCENEYCAVLIGRYDGKFKPNPEEVYEIEKVSYDDFLADVSKNPKKYTPWARLAVKKLTAYSKQLPAVSNELLVTELEQFLSKLEPYAKGYFDKKIREVAQYSPLIVRFYKDLADFSQGGKRLRAFLVWLGYLVGSSSSHPGGRSPIGSRDSIASLQNDIKFVLPIALAIELFHSFLLIQDDIIDKSDVRRGKVTIHKRYEKSFGYHYGISQAIMTSDIACFEAFDLFNKADFGEELKKQVSQRFLKTLLETVYGESLDIEYSYAKGTFEQIRQVTDLKTARYSFVGPLSVGAILGGIKISQIKTLEKYGLLVGTAFQLHDDILGVFGNEEILGKPVLSDLREGKNTILIYKAKELSNKKDLAILKNVWGDSNGGERDLAKVREIIIRCGALDWCKSEEVRLVTEAKRFIEKITKDNQLKAIFEQTADFVINRDV